MMSAAVGPPPHASLCQRANGGRRQRSAAGSIGSNFEPREQELLCQRGLCLPIPVPPAMRSEGRGREGVRGGAYDSVMVYTAVGQERVLRGARYGEGGLSFLERWEHGGGCSEAGGHHWRCILTSSLVAQLVIVCVCLSAAQPRQQLLSETL